MNWIESITKRCWVKSIDQTRILWRVTLVHTAINPRPGGGLHLRHGGDGGGMTPH